MRGADVLIATPGRLLDFAERGKLLLDAASRSSSSTRPTACSTWASSPTSSASASWCRSPGRRCSSRRPCRRKSPGSPSRSCTIRCASRSSRAASTATTITQALVASATAAPKARDAAPAHSRRRELQERASSSATASATSQVLHRIAGEARLLRRRTARRPGPARAHGHARRVPERRRAAARLLRRRGARPRHSRRQPRLQLRRAALTPRTMSTASAAPAAPARPARHSIVTRADQKHIAEIEKLIARKIEWQDGAQLPPEDEAEAPRRERPQGGRGARRRSERPAPVEGAERPDRQAGPAPRAGRGGRAPGPPREPPPRFAAPSRRAPAPRADRRRSRSAFLLRWPSARRSCARTALLSPGNNPRSGLARSACPITLTSPST